MPAKPIIKWCQYCSSQFNAKKESAKFCSKACRTKAYRKRHGIPFPDFSHLVTSKLPTEKERELVVKYDELNSLMLREKAVEKNFQVMLERYKHASENSLQTNSQWSRENLFRRRIEFDQTKTILADIKSERCKLEKLIEDIEFGIETEKMEKKKLIVSADELRNMKFDLLKFDGDWKALLGNPPCNFHLLVYGSEKSGKSSFALQLANYVKKFGSVVYIALDEKLGMSIQRKIISNNITGIDLSKARRKNEISYVIKKGGYKFVVFDSLIQIFISEIDLDDIKAKNPTISFIIVMPISGAADRVVFQRIKSKYDLIVNIESGLAKNYSNNAKNFVYSIF